MAGGQRDSMLVVLEVQFCRGRVLTAGQVKATMSKQRPSSRAAGAQLSRLSLLLLLVFLSTSRQVLALPQTSSATTNHQRYVPPELQVAEPDVKAYLDSAERSAELGNDAECLTFLQRALELATKEKSVADRGIVEDRFAVYYFTQGNIETAKSHWVNSLSDGVAVSNLVLQADVMVALSALQQTSGHLDQAMSTVNQALDFSRKAKSLYMESRVLGELSRLQLLASKQIEARASIEEALQIDRVNRYDWEAGHVLYMAWLNASESKVDKAIEFATSARDLAVKRENYLTFVQASEFLGLAYVHTGRADEGIRTLELARNGVSEQNNPLFKSPDGYLRASSRPYLKVVFLEALGLAYEAAQRPDDALKSWHDLYDATATSNSTLARAEGARHLADLYKAKKEFAKSVDYYALAAEASASGGDEHSKIEDLTAEAALLFQQGDKERALKVHEELLPLVKATKNIRLQFIVDLATAEALDGTERAERTESALKDAESLVGSNIAVPGVEPNYLVELYLRLADLNRGRKDDQQEVLALEKAITPARALANATNGTKNSNPLILVFQRLEARVPEYNFRDAGERAYTGGNFGDALVDFEILQYFEESDAGWKGKYEEYTKSLNNDPTLARLFPISQKIISQDGGAEILSKNIEDMGPIAERIRLSNLGLLTSYYMTKQRLDMVVKFARQALPHLKLGENDNPTRWDVAMACELAFALSVETDVKSALQVLTPCMAGAKKLGDMELLQHAHQTNVWVLDAAGRHDEAKESIDFLLDQKPDDPLEYVQLAQLKAKQDDRIGAADAWRRAIQLYGSTNPIGAADAHLALATLLTSGAVAKSEEPRAHLEAADALYRQLHCAEGQIRAETLLATYYSGQKNTIKAHQYFESAITIARDNKKGNLEANVLFQVGLAYESSGDLTHAIKSYQESADIDKQLNDPANEAFRLKNVANILIFWHKQEEALETLLKAKAVADLSNSWAPRYSVRRVLAENYGREGQYQTGLVVLQEAKQISDDANQPLESAWASLALASDLEIVGSWQEALDQVYRAIPVFQKFKNAESEYVAYTELSAIYGERESELKDLDKALVFYQKAYALVMKSHPERAASLNLDVAEIYWGMGRFKDAISKTNEALDYFREIKDEPDQAAALISRAEAERSDGDLRAAEKSLQLARPLVMGSKNFYITGTFYYNQARLYRSQGRLKESIGQYEQVVGFLEQFKSSSNVDNRRKVSEKYDFIYDELIETYYALGRGDEQSRRSSADKALQYAELNKARAFANSWGRALLTS